MLRLPGNVHYGPDRTDQYENVLINGCFRVWQRGTPIISTSTWANSDDVYCADQWCLLSDGNDRADISRETSVVPSGFNSAIKFDVETVGSPSEQFGILQVVESRDCSHLIGGKVNLSFYARTTSGVVQNLRAVVLSWDGAADTVTSDVVSAWNGSGSDPTWAANWTAENTPSNLALSNTYQRFLIGGVDIDTASTTNIGVFIWVDDTDLIATDVFYIAGVQLEKWYPGRGTSDFVYRPFSDELDRCKRYFSKTFAYGTAPVQNVASTAGCILTHGDVSTDGAGGANRGLFTMDYRFTRPMLASPTVTTYNPNAANASARNTTDGTDTAVTTLFTGDNGCGFRCTAIDNTDEADSMAIHVTAEAVL